MHVSYLIYVDKKRLLKENETDLAEKLDCDGAIEWRIYSRADTYSRVLNFTTYTIYQKSLYY